MTIDETKQLSIIAIEEIEKILEKFHAETNCFLVGKICVSYGTMGGYGDNPETVIRKINVDLDAIL